MNNNKLTTALIGLSILFLVAFIISESRNGIISSERDSYKNLSESEHSKAKYWETESGKHEAETKVALANTTALADFLGDKVDSLMAEIPGIKKNLSNVNTLIGLSLSNSGQIKTHTKDSIIFTNNHYDTARTFSQRNRWSYIRGHFLRDSAYLKYTFYDSLTIVNTWQKKKLFALRELQTNAVTYNPNSEITGLKSYSTPLPKRSRFGIGPFIGAMPVIEDRVRVKFVIGIGVNYQLITL